MAAASAIVAFAEVYGMIGAGVAVLFLLFGLERVAEQARGAYAFRPLLVPGIVVLWPLVLARWITAERRR
jgi:hypothetical protein